MSTIVVTPLVPGQVATTTDVNATLTSFNTGVAVGALDATNTRVEGVDRRTMSSTTHLIGTSEYGDNTTVYVDDTGGVRSVGAYAVIPGLQTASVTVTLPTRLLLHATLSIVGATATFASGVRLRVQLKLQRSDDGGGTWSDLTGTYRSFRFKVLAAPYSTVQPALQRSISWSIYTVPTGAPAIYRVAFQTTDAGDVAGGTNPSFKAGTIFIEPYGA